MMTKIGTQMTPYRKENEKIKNGKWKEFNKHAILISQGVYVNDKKHGLWCEYYDFTGSLMIEETYTDGIQHGCYTSFHPNGCVWSQGEFVNGIRQGYFRVYDEHGNLVRKLLFINNIQIDDKAEYETTRKNTA